MLSLLLPVCLSSILTRYKNSLKYFCKKQIEMKYKWTGKYFQNKILLGSDYIGSAKHLWKMIIWNINLYSPSELGVDIRIGGDNEFIGYMA